jgi:hypothetical protein
MPETGGVNIEVAHHLTKAHGHGSSEPSRLHMILEVVEAIVLALVACATAWSGYQAARWDSHQSELYGRSSKLRVQSSGLSVHSNQQAQYNAANVNEWLKAEAHGDTNLANLFERRFLPEFRPAFEAWKKTDPLHNPNAPAGPTLMAEFQDSGAAESVRLDREATELFEEGTKARERGDNYVRATVTLATVLLLTAIGQRFRAHKIRFALVALAALLLCFPLWHILTLPRH